MKVSLIAIFTFFLSLLHIMSSYAYDWTYTYTDPRTEDARKYIVSVENAELRAESTVAYWKPVLGGSTESDGPGAEIIYHFEFPGKTIKRGFLTIYTSCYHWWYSQGRAWIWASEYGRDWTYILAQTDSPEEGQASYASFADWLPEGLLHGKEFWLKIELYSYGERAPDGGAYTNTAQHSRYQFGSDLPVFRLGVEFDKEVVERPRMDPGALTILCIGSGDPQ